MAQATADGVVLLPIKPKYAEAIRRGEKRIEFRKRPFGRQVRYAVVYASSPCQRVIGYFEIENTEMGTPEDLWTRFSQIGGIERHEFEAYYAGSELAVGFLIDEFHELTQSIELEEIEEGLRAPQSYRYLKDDALEVILR